MTRRMKFPSQMLKMKAQSSAFAAILTRGAIADQIFTRHSCSLVGRLMLGESFVNVTEDEAEEYLTKKKEVRPIASHFNFH